MCVTQGELHGEGAKINSTSLCTCPLMTAYSQLLQEYIASGTDWLLCDIMMLSKIPVEDSAAGRIRDDEFGGRY